jgi:hypothetical protein
VVFNTAHQQLSLEAAQQSIVLLRNNDAAALAKEGIPASTIATAAHLPLKRGTNIAIIGPNGNVSDTYTGQYHGAFCPKNGADHYDYTCLPSAFDAVKTANANGQTSFACGCKYDKHREQTGPQSCSALEGMDDVLAKAKAADVIVLMLGLDIKVTSSEGTDRSHDQAGYALPGKQGDLVQAIAALNKPTVVIMLSGMAVGIDYIGSRLDWPLIIPGYGGIFGPTAIAQTLFGDYAPSGKLPYTIYPEAWAGATSMVDRSLTAGQGRTYRFYGYQNSSLPPPVFAFGDGVSYTSFKHSAKNVGNNSFAVSVSNTGTVSASEAVLVYVVYRPSAEDANASNAFDPPLIPPEPLPKRTLVNFNKTPLLTPGASATLHFSLTIADFSMVDWMGRRATFAGSYDVIFSRGTGAESTVNQIWTTTTLLDTLPEPPPHLKPTPAPPTPPPPPTPAPHKCTDKFANCTTFLQNTDYFTSDTSKQSVVQTKSAAACCAACRKDTECQVFSWANGHNCYLKKSFDEKRVSNGTVAGSCCPMKTK